MVIQALENGYRSRCSNLHFSTANDAASKAAFTPFTREKFSSFCSGKSMGRIRSHKMLLKEVHFTQLKM